jgi:hypothetical protein
MHQAIDRVETIPNEGQPCPCGRVSVVTIRRAAKVNIVRNRRNGAYQIVQCQDVTEGGRQAYRVSLKRTV